MASDKVSQSLQNALRDMLDERNRLDSAIRELQGFLGKLGKRGPGRPPGSGSKRATGGWSPEARKAAAERMKKYWDQRRGGKKKTAKKATAARKGKGWSPAARKAAAERMKKYWAERRGSAHS